MNNLRFILTATFVFFLLSAPAAFGQAKNQNCERFSLDKGWLFHLGDIPFPVIRGHDESYNTSKAGRATGAAATDYDDRDWPTVNLPHDWAVESPFDSTENLSQGYHKRGFGWYRRHFKLNPENKGKHLEIQFDGIATNSTIWLNGTLVHRNWCGYTSSYIDITALAKYGEEINTIAVRVDANVHEGWWYEGAGIYRHTWLVKRAPIHIITDGVYANPIRKADSSWLIPTEVILENSGKENGEVEVGVSITDTKGIQIAQSTTKVKVNFLHQVVASLNIPVINPKLWTLEQPTLYKVKTTVKQNGVIIDELTGKCGFRTFQFTPDSGFYLNGKYLKINGVCNHQDHAGVGVAVPEALWTFRLSRLKEMGVNGYRCAHNPPAAEFLDACDSIGMLVMDENRNFNTSPEYIRQLQWMVRRDRNHPSIILWSVFNEEPMQGTENGYEMVRFMSARVKDLDTTRPITAAQSDGLFTPINVSKAVDVVGFNYQIYAYDRFHKENPKMKLTSSEDVSGLMTRDEYATDKTKHLVDAYDTQKPSWGATHREAWKAILERRFLAGGFIWTGFDYRGEPTPYKWPSVGSFFGTMDQCGFPKTAFWLHQAQWRSDIAVLHLVPHWNWPSDSIGKKIKVQVLSNADSILIKLNGKWIGSQKADKYEMNTWYIPYQPGTLEAVGFKNGKQVSQFKTETTGIPVALQLIPYRTALSGDGLDAMPVTVQAIDRKGRPVPTANISVEFEISGQGKIIGVGNGDPNSHEPDKATVRKLFNGLAQVIIQSNEKGVQPLKLTAKSTGLKSVTIDINIVATPSLPYIAMQLPLLILDKWRVSAISNTRPDPNKQVADNDMNSWGSVKPGQLQEMVNGNFLVFRTKFKPYAAQQIAGGTIIFKQITGKAEVWLDNKLIGTKTNAESADMIVNFQAGITEGDLNVLVESEYGKKAGFGGLVTVKSE